MRTYEIEIVEEAGSSWGGQEPRFDVLVNGEKKGQLTPSMGAYIGGLPMLNGDLMDIGLKPISSWKREAATLNREARQQLLHGAQGPRRIAMARPTSDCRMIFAVSREEGGTDQPHLLSRRQYMRACEIFGRKDVGLGFFYETGFSGNPDEDPIVRLEAGDQAILEPILTNIRFTVMDPLEAEEHERYIDKIYATDDPETKIVVGTRVVDDADPEPYHVSRQSLDFARRIFGEAARIGDLDKVEPVRVSDPATRSALLGQFTWLDLDCEEDAAVRHDREQQQLLDEAEERSSMGLGI